MKQLKKDFERLITMYKSIRDCDTILKSEWFDGISYDITGFETSFLEATFTKDEVYLKDLNIHLNKQVSNASKLAIAIRNMNFIYG